MPTGLLPLLDEMLREFVEAALDETDRRAAARAIALNLTVDDCFTRVDDADCAIDMAVSPAGDLVVAIADGRCAFALNFCGLSSIAPVTTAA